MKKRKPRIAHSHVCLTSTRGTAGESVAPAWLRIEDETHLKRDEGGRGRTHSFRNDERALRRTDGRADSL